MIHNTIDIVLPNYNKNQYIDQCLSSLINQTFSNWRCIVVDGFSDDGSWQKIQYFANNDKRFELYQIPRQGLYNSWNFGLSKVRNPYFCILTSDDFWNPRWLETAVKSLDSCRTAVCAAARTRIVNGESQLGDIAPFNSTGERFFKTFPSSVQIRSGNLNIIANYFIGPIYSSIHSLLLRTDILSKGEKFSEDIGSTADYEWYIKLGFYGDIIYHPDIEVGWRFYEGQATQPKMQAENGRQIQEIHRRTRTKIAEELGKAGDHFLEISEVYDRTILAYHYARPCLENIRSQPFLELPQLIKIIFTMPREFVTDCFFKILGKKFYLESSLSTALKFQKIYESL